MRPVHANVVLLTVLLANAVAILFFRFFISVDGPIHVLHASLLEAPWTTADHLAQGITYNRASHGFVGDRVLMVLLFFLSPVQAHDVLAALVCCAVVLSAVAFLCAHGTRMGPAILWLAPVTLNVLLIMGLFHFLLGVAVAFGSVAWWKWFAGSPRTRWAGLLIGALLAWYTHRGSPPLLGVLFLMTLFVGPRNTSPASGMPGRRSLAWRIVLFATLGAAGIIGVLRIGPLVRKVTEGIPDELPGFKAYALLQPFFLLDRTEETWLVLSIGLLLSLSFATGLWARWRMGRRVVWHDALLVLLLSLTLIAWVYGTPTGHKVFIAERCQWLALLVLAIWLAAIADAHRGWIPGVIGGAALCALPLHIGRLVMAERSLVPLRDVYGAAMEASKALAPGSLVIPVVTDPDPLLQHLEAFVAIQHKGILMAPAEHVHLELPTTLRRHASWLYTEDPAWLVRHWRRGIPPEVDQVLFMGSDIERAVSKHPWPTLLGDRFRLSFDNGYARIYTAVPRK
jgi:hypothetical protein